MWLFLADKKRTTVDCLQSVMSSKEFTEQCMYYKLKSEESTPLEWLIDKHMARLVWKVSNMFASSPIPIQKFYLLADKPKKRKKLSKEESERANAKLLKHMMAMARPKAKKQ